MKIIDQLKKVNLIQFVPAIFVISLVGNSVFGYTAPKSEKSKNNSENQVEAATTQAKKKTKKANAGDIDLSKIKDGTYEGQANGYRGLVKVSVTVKDHKITAIKVLSNSDDAAFFNRASAGVIKNILAKQSLKVDVVSGATYSSNGIIKAVKNALTGEEDKSSAKAGGSSAKSAGSVGTADESGTYKDFMRIVRLQRTLSIMQHNQGIGFARLSYECGYTDQSHMIKEFKLFSGYTPKEYIAQYSPVSDYFTFGK